MRTEVSAISFIGTSLLDEGWCSCSPPRACFKAVAAFFSTGHSLDTLVAQLVGSGERRRREQAIVTGFRWILLFPTPIAYTRV